MENPSLREWHWGYLAAMIDGEGTITITRHAQRTRRTFQYKPKIVVVNTNRELVLFLHRHFGGSVIFEKRPGKKLLGIWRVMNMADIRRLLVGTLPYLIVKKERAEIMMDFLNCRERARIAPRRFSGYGPEEAAHHLEIHKLNLRSQRKEAA